MNQVPEKSEPMSVLEDTIVPLVSVDDYEPMSVLEDTIVPDHSLRTLSFIVTLQI
jgi:hypothetical protein